VADLLRSMGHRPGTACGGLADPPEGDDPLAPFLGTLDQAHRAMCARELAALLLEVNRLAAGP